MRPQVADMRCHMFIDIKHIFISKKYYTVLYLLRQNNDYKTRPLL